MMTPYTDINSHKHHFVPQYYLKNWTRKDGRLYRINKEYSHVKKEFPAAIMYSRYFHTNDVPNSIIPVQGDEAERYLNKRYENLHARTLVDLLSRLNYSSEPISAIKYSDIKAELAEMLAVQLYRTPRIRENMRAAAEREAARPGTSYTAEEFMKQTHLKILTDGSSIEKLKCHFSNFTMMFMINNGIIGLMTSDTPIITAIHNPNTMKISLKPSQEVASEYSEIYFPLSPRHILIAMPSIRSRHDGIIHYISDNQVRQINDLIYHDAEKIVVSQGFPEGLYFRRRN